MKSTKYRKNLEALKNKDFIVVAKVAKRGTKLYTSVYGNKYRESTMLLTNIRCCVRKDKKLKTIIKVHHVWISAESSSIVNNFKIRAGHKVMFSATVTEYAYKNGTKQLGLVQTSKSFKFR